MNHEWIILTGTNYLLGDTGGIELEFYKIIVEKSGFLSCDIWETLSVFKQNFQLVG